MSRVLVFEPPPGVGANLKHILAAIPAGRMAKAPVERCHMHFIHYINAKRTEFLFDVGMPSPSDVTPAVWYQRGLALVAWARQDRTERKRK